jgi:hypothetical protein
MLIAHNRMECMLYLVTGQRALYRGGDNPDNLRGMAASAAWIDEITLCHDPQILPVVQGRLLDLKGRLRFTGTPKGKNRLCRQCCWLLVAHATGTTDALALDPCARSAHRTT